jgi:antitoxin component of MazEF toxin-antitoxin module
MIKTITKIGNSQGIVFDAALMELARLKVGDQVNVTVHDGGTLTVTPMRPVVSEDEAAAAARDIIGKNDELFRRLS